MYGGENEQNKKMVFLLVVRSFFPIFATFYREYPITNNIMMKNYRTTNNRTVRGALLALLSIILMPFSAAAETYDNANATVTWAFTSAENLSAVAVPVDAFLTTNFVSGSNLNLSSVTRNGKDNAWGQDYNMVAFTPKVTVAKNAGKKEENTLQWTITPANGITFTPTKVKITGCNYGGTGDPKTNIYVTYSDNSEETIASSITLNRDDRSDVTSPYILSYTLENAKPGVLVLKVWMDALTNTAKGVAFTNIIIEGTISGTPVASTTYTISANCNPSNAGAITGTGTFAENTSTTLTATANAGYAFDKWTKASDPTWESTVNPLKVTVAADETYTAVYHQLYSVTFSGINDYLALTMNPLAGPYYADANNNFTIPTYAHKYLYGANKTFSRWKDQNDHVYQSGNGMTLTENATLTPIFNETTKTIADVTAPLTVTWDFSYSTILFKSWQSTNKQGYYTQTATVGDEAISIPLFIDPTNGKIDNSRRANENNAQVNDGTIFTIPATKGMVVEVAAAYNSYDFSGTTIAGTNVTTDMVSGNTDEGKTLTYTYTGDASSIDLVAYNVGFLKTIKATYPVQTKYTTVYNIAASLTSNFEGTSGTLAPTTADEAANAPDLQIDATAKDAKLGVNNASWAQINEGTVLTLPGVPAGAEVSFVLYNNTALTIGGTAYTNGQTYTATKDENLTMTCTTSGYIERITVVGTPFVTITPTVGYSNIWYFGHADSAPDFALQGSAEYEYTVNEHSLVINTDAGKLSNAGRTDKWAQCNDGTTFKVPTFEGARVSWKGYTMKSTTGFTIGGTLYNDLYIAMEEGTTDLVATGIEYIHYIEVEPLTVYDVTGTISGGDINGTTVKFIYADNGQEFTAPVANNAFTVRLPEGKYEVALSNGNYMIDSPEYISIPDETEVTITIMQAQPQTVSGHIANAPATAFTLTFTGANHTETVECAAGATSYTKELMPDTYTMSSPDGTLSALSQAAITVKTAAVTHNIYFPEAAVPAATQQNITVDNTATVAANVYNTVTDALAAALAGNISEPIITLTSGQTYQEQVVVDIKDVTLKTSGEEKATITWYYGIGYTYNSLSSAGIYSKDQAMTHNTVYMVDPVRWGATVLVRQSGKGFKAENIIFENSFNQRYTDEEVADGVTPNGKQSINYDRTLTPGQTGYQAADTKAVTERAAAICFENNPTGCELLNCVFLGSQDTFGTNCTLHVKNCTIMGNTDFICGGGYVVFDDCDLVIGGYSDQESGGYITASNNKGTYVFRDCTVKKSDRTYCAANLGRDWGGKNSNVFFFNLKNEMGNMLSYTWTDMNGAVNNGTANLHIYDFDPTINANYNTTGATGANVNGILSDELARFYYTEVTGSKALNFTPAHVYDIPLDEDSYYNSIRIAASDNGTGNVTLKRTISANKWNTLVLPFDMTAEQVTTTFGNDVKLARISGLDGTTITCQTADQIYANEPMFINVSTAVDGEKTIEGVTIVNNNAPSKAAGNGVEFIGSYAPLTNIPFSDNDYNYYFVASNHLYKTASSGTPNTIKGFRAYFKVAAAEASRLTGFVIDDDPTSIIDLRSKTDNGSGYMYDLQGRRVTQPAQGLYIHNGKKVIIK